MRSPTNVQALITQGTQHHQRNELQQAQACYQQALQLQPNNPDALHLLGILAYQTGHHQPAEQLIRRAIANAPQAGHFHTSLGHVLRAQQRLTEAETAYRVALRALPNAAESHHNLGLALKELGRTEDAEAAFRQALRLKRDFTDCRLDLGNLLIETKRYRDAEACIRAALRGAPDHPKLHNALGLALIGTGQHKDAIGAFDHALRIDPAYLNAAVNRAHCLTELQDYESAEPAYAALFAAAPDDIEVRLAYGNVLTHLKRGTEDALPHLQRVVALAPDNAQAWFELGMAYRDLGRWPDAVAPHAEAVRLSPEDSSMRSCLAYALLANGDFEQGWAEFHWRTKRPGNVRLREPEWDGQPTDKTVIIHAEQGIGDTLQFCRFIPQAGTLARIVIAAPRSLQTLMEALPNVAQVAIEKPLPPYDLHIPVMSLPVVLGIPPDRFAETVPYVHADPARVAVWRERLAPLPGRRVGVVWAGNPKYPLDRKRSMPFAALAPLLAVPGVSFVSLQVGAAAPEGAAGFAFDAAPLLGDYADTAAAIAALDLVISVDTSVAHLAGAMGHPVWLLNRADTDWRWLLDRADSPWYPSMRIFRQVVPGSWESVVSAAVSELSGGLGPQAPAGS